MFLVSLRYLKPLEEVDRFVGEHRDFLERFYASGHLLLSGRKDPRTGGVILLQAPSRDAAEQLIRQDPFHREGIAAYEIVEFHPSMAAAGLDHLMER